MTIDKGTYVLATKWHDGDPLDHWCVGFYDGQRNGRHFVVDGDANQMRGNGFRRVDRISAARGKWLLANSRQIEQSGRSMRYWLRAKMNP